MLFGINIQQTDPGFVNNPAFNQGTGSISGLTFSNINTPQVPSRMSYINGNGNVTATSTGDIKNVTFNNFTIVGTLITALDATNYFTRKGNTSNFIY